MALPKCIRDLTRAAAYFGEQYTCTTLIEVRGSVIDAQNHSFWIPMWQEVGMVDPELDLLGVGEVGWDDEELAWVRGTETTEVRFSPMEQQGEDGGQAPGTGE